MIQSYQQLFGQESKTTGTKLEVDSHRLLVQAGYIRESVAGRYYLLPLGLRVHDKIQAIIRQEMNRIGAQEVVAPILHPLELWRETQRDQSVGFELMQIKDRRGGEFALGGTAEEMFVDLVRKFNLSYKNLPLNLYQFGWKFRDEARARGGLLRLREFVMKDAYSFSTPEQFESIYQTMTQTYSRIFNRLGLRTKIVAADGGYIGGDYCHEFVVDSQVGESVYLTDPDGQAVHQDLAVRQKQLDQKVLAGGKLKKVTVDRGPTMADSLAAHPGSQLTDHLKNVAYIDAQGEIVLACLRGDLEVNEAKLTRLTGRRGWRLLTDEEISQRLDSVAGWLSPVGLKGSATIVVDDSITPHVNFISGANEAGSDYQNINRGRDFKPDLEGDIALAKGGDPAPGGGQLVESRGIEVGNIFQLGYHYSEAMRGASYTAADGQPANYYMGCYGIGLARSLAAVVEVSNDKLGLVWPVSIAPYQVSLVGLENIAPVVDGVENLAQKLDDRGLEVLVDDRWDRRPGAKLVSADLLGMPLVVIISRRSVEAGKVEIKIRASQKTELVAIDQAAGRIGEIIDDLTVAIENEAGK